MTEDIAIVRNMLQLTLTPKVFENRKYHYETEENEGRLILPECVTFPTTVWKIM